MSVSDVACRAGERGPRRATATLAGMQELFGDASRDGEWAAVRLRVDGQRIVAADAPGLERDLTGLTLLEAAAVPGETLAADALANAIGPVVAAPPDATRTAVAMSGGVDSAVALLKAGAGRRRRDAAALDRPERARDRARLLLAERRASRRARACHARGIPHVTLDLREEFRRAVVEPFVDGYARGETPNPCVRCNGSFRFDELLAFAERIGAARLATGHYARIVERDGRRLLARAADPRKDQSYMLAARRRGGARPRLVPARRADEGADARRGRGRRARRRAASREPGGVLPRRRRLPRLPRPPRPAAGARAPSSTRPAASSARHDGFWRFTPGQRRGLGIAAAEPLYALGADAATNTVVAGPRASLARTRVEVRGRLHAPARAGRGEAPLPLARAARDR